MPRRRRSGSANRQFAYPSLTAAVITAASLITAGAANAAPARASKTDCRRSKSDKIECVVVTGRANLSANSILPTRVTVDGPFGPNAHILDIPRAVTPVTQKLINDANVVTMRDLAKVVPDMYAPTDFGAASLPEIRGQLGDVFEDGVRRQGGNNGFGLPLSFNGVEQINVVKGPPPVIFGTTERVGGFIDLIPKAPDLKKARGSVELADGSWNRVRGQLDYSTPIEIGSSGIRVSLEQRNEGSYYRFAHYHSTDAYVAYRLLPDARSQLDASFEYFHVNFTDIAGINRPTQALINHGTYITGQGVQPDGSTVPGPFAVISPTGSVRIARSNVLTYPGDIDHDNTYLTNIKYQRTLANGVRFINRLYYQHLSREEVSQDSFVEIIKGANSFEDRAELVADYGLTIFGHRIRNQSDTGLDYRYNQVLGYSQFDTEADLPVDLTGPVSNRFIPLTAAQKAQLVQLRPGLYVSPGAGYGGKYMVSDTTDSVSHQLGIFLQQKIDFSSQWHAMLGARGDAYFVSARDPIPPPGVIPARDSITRILPDLNASVTYKPVDALSIYATYSYSQSTSNSIGGGTALGANGKIDPGNFATDNFLYEGGIKYGPPNGPWYADAAVFEQKRALRNRDGTNSAILTEGIEAQLFYRPTQRAYVTVAGSYLDARYDNSTAFQDTRQVADAFNCSQPAIICGTGVGAPNFPAFPSSNARLQGIPRYQASAVAGYEFPFGLGGTLALRYTSPFPLDYLETVTVRNQYTLDASVYYHYKKTGTELRLDVFNITDQKNWAPVFDGGYFGATDVFPELPINFMVTLRQRV